MIDIIKALNEWTSETYSELNTKLFGFCELMRKSAGGNDQVMPVTVEDRRQVSLDDRRDLVTWIRVPGSIQPSNNIEDQDWSFGLDDGVVQFTNIRWIVAHKSSLGENFIHQFLKDIPSTLDVDGYQIVSIDKTSSSVDFDHEAIYTAELGNTTYEKHRFTWNIYAISLNVEFIMCETSE